MKRALSLALLVFTACAGSPADDAGSIPAKTEPAAAATSASNPLTLFESDEGLSGYRDADGTIVIPARYPIASPFTGEVAAVVGDEGWVFIDKTGKTLALAFVFDNVADEFADERARIVADGKYGFLASTGEIVVAPTWSFVERFSGGYAAVCEGCVREQDGEHFSMTGGTWGYVDTSGKVVIAPRFERAGPFTDGRASVREAGREFVIGTDGAEPK